MKPATRINTKLIVVLTLTVAAGGVLIGLVRPTRPDAAAAIRDRLLGEDSRAVEAMLGQPAFRENKGKTWHYMDRAVVGRFADSSVADQTLVVEFDQDGSVCQVYLAE